MRSYGITNAAPYAVAPPVGLAGDTYFNTTSKTMFLSDGTQWIQVQGGSSTANYWISRLVANTAISTTIEGTLPISAATMAAGFTLGAGGANIVCQVAGKYAASLVLMTGTSTASASPFWVGIQHYRGATGIITWDNIGLSAVNGYPYNQVIATGEFDMQVGDTLACVAQAPATTYTVGAQSTFMVWPMGGPKGDKGDTGLTGGTAPTVGARIRRNVDQGVANGALANIVFNVIETEVVGALGGTFYDSNTGGLKIPPGRAGVYAIWSHCRWEANSTTGFWSVLVNNVMIARDSPGVGAAYLEQNVATTRYLNDGDSITVTAYQGSGATRNVSALGSAASTDPAGPILEIWRIDGSQGPPGPTGAQGIAGGPVPVGGIPNFQVVTKTGVADGVVGWTTPQHLLARPICWRTPAALLNTWTNYGNQFSVARYGKKNGMIYLQGLVNRAANAAGPNITMFGMDFGYSPHGLVSGQTDLLWVPAGAGGQLARLDFVTNNSGGCNVVTSDQTGAGATTAGWCSIANVSIPMDTLTGIEQGFEYVLNGDNTTTVQPGAFWWFGTRYEVNTVTTLPAVSSGASSTVRVIFAGLNPSSIPSVGQTRDANENNGLANSRGNGWSNLSLIAVGPYPGGPLSSRYEWC